ncbi:BTB/POZ domain-containing protein 6-A-like [Bradysia coprophila]|uniref:BTB/POZ domain-containing protein 6-A-like n=1 Tax=Bradysia coprophila TaxID=38358 RepID=UPI00187DD949|nr:BTB/POZ domain-containing protein 6-A-like [Bradysia coprophila]
MNEAKSTIDDIPLAIESRIKWFVNNQRFADITFVVGKEKEIVYAHKNIMASGSPVFEQMFFANHDLKMTGSEPIEIPDLTPAGFINMLTYIYTNEFNDLDDLSELFETFVAGDKYQVYNMNDAMFSFIKDVLNESNCCIIYDQLMKFPSEYLCVPVDQVRTMIRYNSGVAFNDEYFVDISQETLVDLLNMDALSLDEIDVLRSCAKWVDEEIRRLNLESNAANKQKIFKPFKNLIGFSRITLDQLEHFSPIKDLLSSDELSSLFLHHLNISQLTIECNAARKTLTLKSATCDRKLRDRLASHRSEFRTVFNSSGEIFIAKIYSFLHIEIEDLEFSIHDNVSGQKVELNYEKLRDGDDCWHFRFIDFVKIDAAKDYTFTFKFQIIPISNCELSCDTTVMIRNASLLKFYLSLDSFGYHCLKKIDFFELS